MAKVKKLPPPTSLILPLHAPGMTPVLRAGLGGLAASLHVIEQKGWSDDIPGSWTVESHQITLNWEDVEFAEPFFKALFEHSFQLRSFRDDKQLIYLPGIHGSKDILKPELLGALQDAMRRTMLQHGKTAKKDGSIQLCTFEYDEKQIQAQIQPYAGFAHRTAWTGLVKELKKPANKTGTLRLAGWANPGAVQRHVGYAKTNMDYTPAEALCACFSLVGTISYLHHGGGSLVVPVPADLRQFGKKRSLFTPRNVGEVHMGSVGDAVLSVHLALRLAGIESSRAVEFVAGMSLQATAWASQQKSRVSTVEVRSFPPDVLRHYHKLASKLPAQVIAFKGKGKNPDGYFSVPSELRGFICDNLAQETPWYTGFATARSKRNHDRFLHYAYDNKNKGALRRNEKEGLRMMLDHLEEAEQLLVESVHIAIRQRFGAIADDNKTNATARKNRWSREKERWRLAFSGAKTHEQVRHALADLWSRAGSNKALQENWLKLLPLLREAHWQTTRDLTLVALASYSGKGTDAGSSDNTDNN